MRFASIGGSNAANYAAAGKSVADSGAQMFKKQRDSGPDYAGLSQVAMATASNEKIAGMKAEAKVTNIGINQYSRNTQIANNIKADEKIRGIKNSQRKAGGLAAIGKMVGAGFLAATDNTKGRERPKADYSAINSKFKTARDARMSAYDSEIDALNSGTSSDSSSTGRSTPGKVTQQATPTASAEASGYSLSGNAKIVADAIAGPESGSWGYEAFNQGGAASGTRVVGKSGSHKDTFGTPLTSLSLGEIFHRQNTKQRGLSMSEHINSGGLHAVGRYQFIGSTLQNEAKRMGLSLDTKFTPEVQDKIFINHIKRVGNISPWVGPSTKWDQSKKNQINSLISTL